jgi:hypothetical protein
MADEPSNGRCRGPPYRTPNAMHGIEKELRRLYTSMLEDPLPASLLEFVKQLERHDRC